MGASPPGRDHRLIDVRARTEPRLGKKIAGQMFEQKLIVRHALVEGADLPLAEALRLESRLVGLL